MKKTVWAATLAAILTINMTIPVTAAELNRAVKANTAIAEDNRLQSVAVIEAKREYAEGESFDHHSLYCRRLMRMDISITSRRAIPSQMEIISRQDRPA